MYHEDSELRIEGIRDAGIVVKDKRILMIHRIKDGKEYWVLPGGHRRRDEEPESAVIREIEEETGVIVQDPKLVFEFKDYTSKRHEHYYLCSWVSGDNPQLQGEEKVRNSKENYYDPVWIDLDEIEELNILPNFAKEWILENFVK